LTQTADDTTAELPEMLVERRRGFSLVWLIPVVAALIGGWLAYKTLSEQGPTITITFADGAGLEAGKTQIRYKALEVGSVSEVRLSEDLSHVIVTAELDKEFAPHLGMDAKFWVVRPRIGLSGVSGLETLVSGSYIEMQPGAGEPTREFTALEQPPIVRADMSGRKFILQAEKLGSVQSGAPVYFRDIQVGQVLGHELAEDHKSLLVHIFIDAPHDQLVRSNSRFWKTSGIDVSLGADGFNVKMESLLTVLTGGVTFDAPASPGTLSRPVQAGARFALYENFASIAEAAFTEKVPYVLYFNGSVRGLSVGAPVEFRGIKIGAVTAVNIEYDSRTFEVRIPVFIEIEPQRVAPTPVTGLGDLARLAAQNEPPPYEGMRKLVEEGLRAQLKTGSLLTGQLFVDLDFYPNSPAATVEPGDPYPELPTVPSTLDQFQATATELLAKLQQLPLDRIANEILAVVEGAKRLTNAPEIAASLQALQATLQDVQALTRTLDQQTPSLFQDVQKLTRTLNQQVPSLAENVEQTLQTAQGALEIAKPGAPMATDLANTLRELAAAARSIRVLTDYLERHPDALIYGKGGNRR